MREQHWAMQDARKKVLRKHWLQWVTGYKKECENEISDFVIFVSLFKEIREILKNKPQNRKGLTP